MQASNIQQRRTRFVWPTLVGLLCGSPAILVAENPPAKRRPAPQAPPPTNWDRATLDLFLPDVSGILGPRPVATRSATDAAGDGEQRTAPAAPDEDAKSAAIVGDAPSWSAAISAEALEDEIKAAHAVLSDNLKTASKFKSGGFRAARQSLSWLAVLLEVVGRFDGEVRWRESALALRDGAARAGRNCKAASDGTFKEAKARAAELADMLRGQRPEAAALAPPVAWPELVDRAPLMQRLELAQRERLAPWTSGEAEFRGRRDEARHEAQVVALLARVIAHADFEFANEESYQTQASALASAAAALIEASKANDFERAQAAARQATKSCDDCHTNFRS